MGSRAAATDAICGAAPCAIVLPGPFTSGTAELCSGRRLASHRVCCARLLTPSAVCTPADDDTRTRSPRCPNPASSRPCTLRAAVRYSTGHFRRRKQLWDCSQLHLPCRCGNSAVWCRCRRWRNTQSHNEPTTVPEGQREQTTGTGSTPTHPGRSPSEPSYPARFMRPTRTSCRSSRDCTRPPMHGWCTSSVDGNRRERTAHCRILRAPHTPPAPAAHVLLARLRPPRQRCSTRRAQRDSSSSSSSSSSSTTGSNSTPVHQAKFPIVPPYPAHAQYCQNHAYKTVPDVPMHRNTAVARQPRLCLIRLLASPLYLQIQRQLRTHHTPNRAALLHPRIVIAYKYRRAARKLAAAEQTARVRGNSLGCA